MGVGSNSLRRGGLAASNQSRKSSAQQQVVKRQLGIIHSFRKFSVPNSGSRNVESFAHRIEMKADDSRCHANGRNATFPGQTSYGRFAHLQNARKLSRSKKLFAVVHGFRYGIILSQLQGSSKNIKHRHARVVNLRSEIVNLRYK